MIGTLYYSASTKRGEANFQSLPFHNGTIQWNSTEASTMSFKSPVKLANGYRIRYKSPYGSDEDFGGQVYKIKRSSNGEYDYTVISYLRLYHDKVSVSFKNKTASQILKKILKDNPNNLRTSGIKATSIKYNSLKWEKKQIWEIALELQYLEHKYGNDVRCWVDANGTLRFGESLNNQQGYIFENFISYDETLDASNIITAYKVLYNGKVFVEKEASNNLIAVWGYVSDEEDCTQNVSTGSSKTTLTESSAKAEANIKKYNISSKIVKQAQSIVAGKTSDKAKAKAIWKWMHDNIQYKRYACTKKGALGTLNARAGNCADQTHLYMSLGLSVGLEVRCNHINGHFFPQTKLNGKWFDTDTVTRRGWGGHACNGAHWAYYYNPNQFNC